MDRQQRGLWLVVVLVVVVEGRVLQCDVDCSCERENKDYQIDYKVTCNATDLHQATATKQLLAGMSTFSKVSPPRIFVTVSGGPNLTLNITLDFLLQWRQFVTCFLTASGGGRVFFPAVVPPYTPPIQEQYSYAGVMLTGVSTSEVPAGVLSGKAAAGLRLHNSTVGRLPAGLFKGAAALYHLHILNSTVGVVEGQLGAAGLDTMMWSEEPLPVHMANSTVGLLSGGAIHLRLHHSQKIVLQGLSLGRVDPGAMQVEGGGVVVEQCVASRVEAGALLLRGDASLTLRDSLLVLQPGALTNLACGPNQHHLSNNHFSVLHNATALPVILPGRRGAAAAATTLLEEEVVERKRLAGILSGVIHATCVDDNLARLPSPSPRPVVEEPSKFFLTPEWLAVLGVTGLAIGMAVACLALFFLQHYRRRRRSRGHVPSPTIVMSQLREEPIYEEPSPPPKVPPFPNSLRRPSPCPSSAASGGVYCGPEGGGAKRPENEYMVMKGQ